MGRYRREKNSSPLIHAPPRAIFTTRPCNNIRPTRIFSPFETFLSSFVYPDQTLSWGEERQQPGRGGRERTEREEKKEEGREKTIGNKGERERELEKRKKEGEEREKGNDNDNDHYEEEQGNDTDPHARVHAHTRLRGSVSVSVNASGSQLARA